MEETQEQELVEIQPRQLPASASWQPFVGEEAVALIESQTNLPPEGAAKAPRTSHFLSSLSACRRQQPILTILVWWSEASRVARLSHSPLWPHWHATIAIT